MRVVEAVSLFLAVKRGEGLSSVTLAWYEDMLSGWVVMVGADREVEKITAIEIALWLSREAERGLRPGSVDARYRALRAWLNWCEGWGALGENPIKRVKRPRRGCAAVRHVTVQDYRKLAASLGDDWMGLRDRCIVDVLMWSGLRVSECAELRLPDVDIGRRLALVRRGKGGKARVVPIAPDLGPRLLAYLQARPLCEGDVLWLGAGGDPLKPEGVRQLLRRRCVAAGLPVYGPHAFRHGFAMAMLNEGGVEMSALSAMMGHSSEAVTAAFYAHWQVATLQRVHGVAMERVRTSDS